MTARLGTRLAAILSDLGIGHPANPDPVRREHMLPTARAPEPSSIITVMVEAGGADEGALGAAGLRDISPGAGAVVSGHIRVEYVPELLEVPGVVSVEIENIGRPDIHSSVPAIRADVARTGPLQLGGTGVIVGVVDSGIDIFHHAFRRGNGTTRLLSLLDLTAPYTLTATGVPTGGSFTLRWTPPSGATGGGTAQTTPTIPFNATPQQVLAALLTIAAIEPGDVAVTGGPLPGAPIVVAFQGQYLHKDVNPLRVSNTTITPAGTDITVVRGHEYSEADINTALGAPPNVFMSWDEEGHGTHVMGIAAGDGSQAGNCHLADYYIGVAPDASLVAVKTTFADSQTMRGVRHVFTIADQQAVALGHHVAAVVNLSLGGADDGARDGSTQLERDIDTALQASPPGRVIIKSAGNSGALHDHAQSNYYLKGSGSHSRKNVPANGSATMTVTVFPDDADDDLYNFWYTGAGRLSITVKSPVDATTVGPFAPGGGTQTPTLHGHSMMIDNTTNVNPAIPNTHNISLRISPPSAGKVRQGDWVFSLTETAGTTVDVHCWIDQDSIMHPRFVNADQDRQFTLTSPGTARRVISVANYDHRNNTIAESSSRGPTLDTRAGNDAKPDITAPGTGITSAKSGAKSGACCDCCTDFYVAMDGTSMAAPHITGVVALMLQRNHTLTWQQVRDHLRSHTTPPDPATAATLPNETWGAGIANAEATCGAFPAVVVSATSLREEPPARRFVARRRAEAFDELRATVLATPEGQQAFALVSTHLSESMRLVNTDRRVTVAWHRMGGPALLQAVMDGPGDPVEEVRAILAGDDGRARMEHFLDELAEAGSIRLRADIERHREFVLCLPDLDLTGPQPSDVAG